MRAPCLALLLCAGLSTPVLAQPSATSPAPPSTTPGLHTPSPVEPRSEWYGWQIALLDGVSGLIYLASFSDDAGGVGRFILGFTGAMTWFSGAAAHGRYSWGKLFLSAGLRVGAVTAALSMSKKADLDRDDIALYLPALAVSALDILVFARHRPTTAKPPPVALFAAPSTGGGAMLGLGGSF